MAEINLTNLNFDERKESLKNFLKNTNTFKDFDFEGSTMNLLIQLLAYNSYQDSFLLNMAVNEAYIDSAQLRENIVSRAKNLMYLPKSAKSSKATLQIEFSPNDSPPSIVIPKGTGFFTRLDGAIYNFVTNEEYVITPINEEYSETIDVYDGDLLTFRFIYDDDTNKRFILPNENIDLDSLTVAVKPSVSSTIINYYQKLDDLTEITSSSNVYFIEEDVSGFYVIYFGDGVLGKKLESGNQVVISFRVCSGGKTNNILNFAVLEPTGYNSANSSSKYTATNVSVISKAADGAPREDVESIRFNAPRHYTTQNRLVNTSDYTSFIRRNYGDIQSIKVWGGEENDPPIYGKTFISAKPFNGYTLSTIRKEQLAEDIKKISVKTIEPTFIDPDFLFIQPTININYNSTLTTLTADGIFTLVSNKLINYERENLGLFDSPFRFSKFIKMIDDLDSGILSNETEIRLLKKFTPIINTKLNYVIKFNRALFNKYATAPNATDYIGDLTSSTFETPATPNSLKLNDNGKGIIYSYYDTVNDRNIINQTQGEIDYTTGEIRLNDFWVKNYEGSDISISSIPLKKDITTVRNELLLLNAPTINIYDHITGNLLYTGMVYTDGSVLESITSYSTNIIYS